MFTPRSFRPTLILCALVLFALLGACAFETDAPKDDGAPAAFEFENVPQSDPPLVRDAKRALARAIDYFRATQAPEGYWEGDFPSDTSYNADYIMLGRYLERVDEEREAKAANHIVAEQNADGGWSAYPGGPSVLDITVLDYTALKLAGFPQNGTTMKRAREFILANGGADAANLLVRIRLANFGFVPWKPNTMRVHTWLMNFEELMYHYGFFQSALIPMLLSNDMHHIAPVPAGRGIGEIFISDPWEGVDPATDFWGPGCCADQATQWILERQEADGNWAGVLIQTYYSLIALHATGDPAHDDAIERGLEGVRSFQREGENTIIQQFSEPPVMDTAYVLHALLSAGMPPDDPMVADAVSWLLEKQATIPGDWSHVVPNVEPGGWGFEHENQRYPDVDVTVMVLDALALLPEPVLARMEGQLARGIDWMRAMQNDDGGFAAWGKNSLDPVTFAPYLEGETWVPVDDSNEDITARAIVTMTNLGAIDRFDDARAMRRAIDFVKARQKPWGAWFGRWGTNYTYGTGQVLQALAAAGESPRDPDVARAIEWLLSVQNDDGGWGETPQSYLDEALAGAGESTVFQTAYSLIGLQAIGADQNAIDAGIAFLLDEQLDDGSWFDHEFLGTNLPGYWYSRYTLLASYKAMYALVLYLEAHRD
ncbi:hypothetical protein K8I61_06550 [bacterium]|nr:hypothetical protein [bacterium]